MNCPICKNELEIKQKKVGENAAGETIYNEFAICHNCKKQWNLDKQRAKKQASAEKKEPEKKETEKKVIPEKAEPEVKTVVSTEIEAAPKAARPKQKRKVEEGAEQPVKKRKKRPVMPDDATKQLVKPVPATELSSANPKSSSDSEEVRPRKVKKKRPVSQTDSSSRPVAESPHKPVADSSDRQTSDGTRPKKKRPVNPDGTPVHRKPASEHREGGRPVQKSDVHKSEAGEHPRKPKKRPVSSVAEDYSNDFVDFDRDDNFEEIAPVREKSSYSNIHPKHIREAREKEMRENYQNMLDEDDEEAGGAPVVLILIIIIILLAIAAFCGYWFILR